MRVLLDTNIVLWLSKEGSYAQKDIQNIISKASEVYVSKASLWEIATKINIGKLKLKPDFFEKIEDTSYTFLDISKEHILDYMLLPAIHKDPFDKMLIAQARCEDMLLITADTNIVKYKVKTRLVE